MERGEKSGEGGRSVEKRRAEARVVEKRLDKRGIFFFFQAEDGIRDRFT